LEDPERLEDTDYFSFFRLDKSYVIDSKQLKEKYKRYQHTIHPDKFQGKLLEENSQKVSSFASSGFQILNCDFERAVYLVSLD